MEHVRMRPFSASEISASNSFLVGQSGHGASMAFFKTLQRASAPKLLHEGYMLLNTAALSDY
jgi:hypothetical protein